MKNGQDQHQPVKVRVVMLRLLYRSQTIIIIKLLQVITHNLTNLQLLTVEC